MRGLCRECATEIPNGLACRERCEAEASRLSSQIQEARGVTGLASLIWVLLGLLIITHGLLTNLPYSWLFGGGLLLIGGFLFVRSRRTRAA